jgi:uncharacterized protein YjbK
MISLMLGFIVRSINIRNNIYQEFPKLKYHDGIDNYVLHKHKINTNKIRDSRSSVQITLDNRKKISIIAYNDSLDLEIQDNIFIGNRIVKGIENDTLFIFGNNEIKSIYILKNE